MRARQALFHPWELMPRLILSFQETPTMEVSQRKFLLRD
jgi:hypothetical protein